MEIYNKMTFNEIKIKYIFIKDEEIRIFGEEFVKIIEIIL